MSESSIKASIKSSFGVDLDSSWLTECILAINEHEPNADLEGAVYNQLIHADLRDAVNASLNHNPNQLREAVRSSLLSVVSPPGANPSQSFPPATFLPKDFRIMVQLEEVRYATICTVLCSPLFPLSPLTPLSLPPSLPPSTHTHTQSVDVSTNAEHRAQNGSTSSASFTNPGMYSKRCLKMALCDGVCTSEPNADPASATFVRPVVAVETSPIPSLSVNTLGGCKLLLVGPAEVSMGALMLGPANVQVLGGMVEDLVRLQDAAVAQAKKKYQNDSGGGATLRALVWNNQNGQGGDNPDEEEGVGEGESGDVDLRAIEERRRNEEAEKERQVRACESCSGNRRTTATCDAMSLIRTGPPFLKS